VPFRILTAPLKVLRALYGPPGQLQAPLDIEYGLPIQVVHDVSREAELGTFDGSFGGLVSGRSPYFTIDVDQVHAAIGTIQTLIGVYANQAPTWALATWTPPDPRQETVWILNVVCMSLNRLVNNAVMMSRADPKAGAGAGNAPFMPLFTGTTAMTVEVADAQSPVNPLVLPGPFPVPVSNKLLNNTVISLTSAATDADTITWLIQCIRLPNGVFPPGLR